MLTALIIATVLQSATPGAAATPAAPPPQQVAPGVTLIPGAILPGRGPDGNTIILDGSRGLVVVDTGRHVWQSDAILAYAAARRRPVGAIINTHWHLDHSSGNRRIKAVFPNARVYTTNAIDRALGPDGFLTSNLAGARQSLSDANMPALQREETEAFIATMEASPTLRPDVTLSESHRMRFAGRQLDVHVTHGAVTDADVWLYDRRTHVAIIGDLVTFPAPFFETACPNQWRAELDAVWATPFTTVIPGHGAPMTREQFGVWRTAYGAFIDCVNSDAEAATCASGWQSGVASLSAIFDLTDSAAYANYYVSYLRENGHKSPSCLSN